MRRSLTTSESGRHTQRTAGAKGARQRGSAIILVVAALVLSMLMGLAYMSVARQDRITPGSPRGIDEVERSILSRVIEVLREDLGHERLDELDGDDNPTGETFAGFFQMRDEDRDPFLLWNRPAMDYPGPIDWADPGEAYSPWLASTAPLLFDPAEPDNPELIWGQISRLTDGFVNQWGEVTDPPDREQHWEDPEELDPNDESFLTLATMADASGDGILDSRWEQAPLFSVDGIDYYFAIRLVDNTARVNANIAFSQVAPSGQYAFDYDQSLRWEYPTELDLGSLVFRYGELQNEGPGSGEPGLSGPELLVNDVEPFIEWRAPGITQALPVTPEEREWVWDTWHYGKLRATDAPAQLTINSEFALRYRDGLKNPRMESGVESPDRGLARALRQYDPIAYEDDLRLEERFWGDALDNMLDDVGNPPYPNVTRPAMVNYFDMNPRAKLTTRSGYVPHGEFHRKDDLKTLIQTEDLDRIIEVFWDVYGGEEGLDVTPGEVVPPGLRDHAYWTTELASDQERLAGFASQYAVNLLAFTLGGPDQFLANDDVPADPIEMAMPRFIWPGVTPQRRNYGMRPLPHISEVYSQQKYIVTQVEEDEPEEGQYTVTWEAVATAGYVIEIRNPHNYPIRVDTVRVVINDPNESQPLNELIDRDYMDPDEAIYLMRHSGGHVSSEAEAEADPPEGPTEPEQDDVVRLVVDTLDEEELTPTWVVMDQPGRDVEWVPAGGGGTPINIELITAVRDVGDPAADENQFVETYEIDGQVWYRYQKADGHVTYETPIEVVYDDDPGLEVDDEGWEQQVIVGDGRELNMITIRPGQFQDSHHHKTLEEDHAHREDRGATLGMVIKTGHPHADPTEGPITEWADEQLIFPKQGRLRNVGELALVTTLAPRGGGSVEEWTLAHAWETSSGPVTSVRDFQMPVGAFDLEGNPLVVDDLHEDGVSHMMVLMDRFSAHRYWDSEDQPELARFTPGTININTATRETLLAALPVPWDDLSAAEREDREATRRAIVDFILAYRDNVDPASRPAAPWREEPGIRYVGEIYAATWHLFGNTGEDAYELGGIPIDRLSNPEPGEADGIADDLEEKTLVLRMLSQLLTTRSDVYTAHILIRGYPAAQDEPNDPVVERRLMAIIDRSPVFTVDADGRAGTPRVLGIYRY